MAVGAQAVKDFGRKQADGALGAAVVPAVTLAISRESILVDHSLRHGALGHAAGRHVELFNPPVRSGSRSGHDVTPQTSCV